jgi:hypothetical protein
MPLSGPLPTPYPPLSLQWHGTPVAVAADGSFSSPAASWALGGEADANTPYIFIYVVPVSANVQDGGANACEGESPKRKKFKQWRRGKEEERRTSRRIA